MFAMGPAFFGSGVVALALSGTFPSATVGVAYDQYLTVSGGVTPYSLTGGTGVASGTLPAGMSLSISGSQLHLSGTPTTGGTDGFTVSVGSADAQTATSAQSVVVSSTAYSDAVLADSPYLYWRFGETSGKTAADSSGNSRNGTYRSDAANVTAASLISGSSDPSIFAAAGSAYSASCSKDTGIDASTANVSADIVIKPSSAPVSSGVGVCFLLGYNQYAPEVDVLDIGGGSFRLRVMSSGIAQIFRSAGSWAYGTKLHVALTYNPTSKALILYVNGAVDTSTTYTYVLSSPPYTQVGFDGRDAAYTFAGGLDEFALYASELSATRIAAHAALV